MSQIQPATKLAKHFSVRYYVSVTTEFDGCICTDQPSNKTPMTIMPSVNPNAYGFQPPSDYVCTGDLGMKEIALKLH